MSLEKVSCICITYKRVSFLKRSIECFNRQTHSNKEMLIMYQDNDQETADFIAKNREFSSAIIENGKKRSLNEGRGIVNFFRVSSDLTLGDKRNLMIDNANGEFVCVWDDDDYFDHQRIEKQLCFLKFSEKSAVVLANLTLFDERSGDFYVGPIRPDGWEGSLLCRTDKIGKYHSLNKKEDTPVIEDLIKRGELSVMEDHLLYVYYFHSSNTSGTAHFDEMINYAVTLENLGELLDDIMRVNCVDFISGKRKIIIGLGSVGTGTFSLAEVLHEQNSSKVFSENFPLPWKVSEKKLFTALSQLIFQKEDIVGDLGAYYLQYVNKISQWLPETKFVGIIRDKDETISHFMENSKGKNHWCSYDSSYWDDSVFEKDPVCDDCFPKFELNKRDAIERYWEVYMKELRRLEGESGLHIKLLDLSNSLKMIREQEEVIRFLEF